MVSAEYEAPAATPPSGGGARAQRSVFAANDPMRPSPAGRGGVGIPQGNNCVIVAKFPRTMGDKALGDSFISIVGRNIVNCRIMREKRGRSLCYGFVEFADEVATQKALTACRLGEHVLLDEAGRPWQVTANRAHRRTFAPLRISSRMPPPVETYDNICFRM
jgi:hypothetical protein